ncbi:MAG TPA: hypothetical protein VGG84_07565 [Gemmatimonadaceae bacterium]
MTRRSKFWLVTFIVFDLVNLAGAVMAAAGGELLHAGTHVALLALGLYVTWRLVSPDSRPAKAAGSPLESELTDRLTNIEQAVDAVAIEVERVGEGQRFMTRALSKDRPQAAGETREGGVDEPPVRPKSPSQ